MSQLPTVPAHVESLFPAIQGDLDLIEVRLRQVVHSRLAVVPEIYLHTVDAGGKRIRPALTLLCARLMGGIGPTTYDRAVAVELIHLASLLHDDVVDNSDMRRARMTANRIWGNKNAVLVADFAQATAVHLLARVCDIETIANLSVTVVRMAEGELCQVYHEGSVDVDEALYYRMIGDKTASLLALAARLGAEGAGGDERAVVACETYGEKLGLAFQVVDDLLDLTGDEETIGKPVGSDVRCGRLTLAPIHALSQGGAAAERVQELVCATDPSQLDLPALRAVLEASGSIDYARRAAERLAAEAVDCLDAYSGQAERDALVTLAEYVLARTK